MSNVAIRAAYRGGEECDVVVDDRGHRYNYRLLVPEDLRARLGDPGHEQLAVATVRFLMGREALPAIPGDLALDAVTREFPDYEERIRDQL